MRIIPTYGVEANFLIIARLITSITTSLNLSTTGQRNKRLADCGDA
jgi:hypothetical protein